MMLAVDLFAHRRAHVIGVREAALWSAVWVAFGLGFGALVWQIYGAEFGQQYFAGYLIEKSLAVDNVFIWAIIFTYFAVPREYQHRVLFLGVLGALVFRGIFIAAGSAIIASAEWVLYIFAAFLLLTGYRMIRHRNDMLDPEKSRALKLFRRRVPMTDDFHGQRFLIRKNGVLLATPLLAVLVLIEVTDIIFAVDSIPAIFAVTDEVFLLPNRKNIIVTRQENLIIEGCEIANSLQDALKFAADNTDICIIGGAEIYNQSFGYTDVVYLTRIHHQFDADTYFPLIDPNVWEEISVEAHQPDEKNKYRYTFITYSRK